MQSTESYVYERVDHLGIVAGVCEEIGIAAYVDRRAGETKQYVSMGRATVAMIVWAGHWTGCMHTIPCSSLLASRCMDSVCGIL